MADDLSSQLTKVIKKYHKQLLDKSFICPIMLYYTSLVLIGEKKEKSRQVCIDHCVFNSFAIKNWNIFLWMKEILA